MSLSVAPSVTGADGSDGVDGVDGSDGVDGVDGVDGSDGAGVVVQPAKSMPTTITTINTGMMYLFTNSSFL